MQNRFYSSFILRVQEHHYKKIWEGLKSGESYFDCMIESKDKTINQMARAVPFMLSNDTIEVLVTSLFDREKFTLESLKKAYALSWHIEACYKPAKVKIQLESIYSRDKVDKPKRQDVFTRIC